MTTKGSDSSQANVGPPAPVRVPDPDPAPPGAGPSPGQPPGPPPGAVDPLSRPDNGVFKSGPLFIQSKGIGWTSWKKRWFILTHTSLVFFRSDPSVVPQKGSEVNLTLGGIDLNNSGSVVVKAEKKLLTVLFPDGRDGRAFTLKAETLDDLYEWKTALENALAQAPSTASVMGQNGICNNDQAETPNGSIEQSNNKPVKLRVIGRPILLALEDVDGTPSFLEKALRFIEEHGVKVEGILRQAADVDDVERRIREFEQGKTEFSSEEDAHIVADCVKYFIRELPSYPVPASCCKALLEARRTDRGSGINAIRTAICETFPEPNRRLLQRILTMMQTVASNKNVNRMSTSAVAACMAPLLLRPLLAGDCEIETDFDVGVDSSVQLLQAAAAANHAQAIVITLLEEYDNIFGEGSLSPGLYSEESESETEEASDDDGSYEDNEDDDTHDSDASTDDDLENASSGPRSESCGPSSNSDQDDYKMQDSSSGSESPESSDNLKVSQKASSSTQQISMPQQEDVKRSETILNQGETNLTTQANEPAKQVENVSKGTSSEHNISSHNPISCMQKSMSIPNGPEPDASSATVCGQTAVKKNRSMKSDDSIIEDEAEIQRLEATKSELQKRIADEVKGNEILLAGLERRKKAIHERRLALEKDVARLLDQLQNEREKKTTLESVLNISKGSKSSPATNDEKTKVEIEEIGRAESEVGSLQQKLDDLGVKLNQQLQKNYGSTGDSGNQLQQTSAKLKDKKGDTEASAPSHVSERSSKDICRVGAVKSTSHEKKRESTSKPNKNSSQNQQLDSTSKPNTNSSQNQQLDSNSKPNKNSSQNQHLDSTSKPNKNSSQNQQLDSTYKPNKNSSQNQQLDSTSKPNKNSSQNQHLDSTSKLNKNSSQNQQLDSTNNSNTKPPASSNTKKSGSKGEGSNSSSLSLSKLTTRLNFLKERRNQIACELQNYRGSQAARSQDKSRGSETQNTDKSQGSEAGREGHNSQSLQNMDKRTETGKVQEIK
ncbi:rho GTPase-activating protein REN1-like isoform X2 [Mangifera indica]|uniref:rho GTPase-activating protein REN1-like isoform X2 n=1 Tax=Mangifera indica TaxID=29780 RepID=UPI001CF9A203|nr:rho GTPase-activating protein REN1-like isoform X2 [Mangifera indica]